MDERIATLLRTDRSRLTLALRVVAGLPLVGIGAQHLSGAAPLLPIIQGTPLPFPELNAVVGPITQVIGGLMLLAGAGARLGAAMGVGAMVVALFSHATFTPHLPPGSTELFTWSDEPPLLLPIAVLLASSFVALRGAGVFSVDGSVTRAQGLGPGVAAAATLLGVLSLAPAPAAQAEAPESEAARAHYDLDSGVAVHGYDPVSYFDGTPKKGQSAIATKYLGAEYHFASEANRAKFLADPDRYRPAYGGWCAWAMTSGGKTEPDPENFVIQNDRLMLFYKGLFGDTKKSWQAGDTGSLEKTADGEWGGLIGG